MNKGCLAAVLKILLVICLILGGIYWWFMYPRGYHFSGLHEAELSEHTKEDYMADFETAFTTLEKHYPFFEVAKIKRGDSKSWPEKKIEFRKRIAKCSSDAEFYHEMQKILAELENGHTHLIPEDMGMHIFSIYYPFPRGAWYQDLAKAFLSNEARARYGISKESCEKFIQERNKFVEGKSKDGAGESFENLKVEFLMDGKVAYLGIESMLGPDLRSKDMERLQANAKEIKEVDCLILDIRGNGGGHSGYVFDFLLPSLISKEKIYESKSYDFVREFPFSPLWNKLFELNYKEFGEEELSTLAFPEETKKMLKGFRYFRSYGDKVRGCEDGIDFKGPIYLLVDSKVFSSSEKMAIFCKESGLATLVGARTGGDGIGSDPILLALPRTGYVLRYSLHMGVTETGSINELDQTEPDLPCDAERRGPLMNQAAILTVLRAENLIVE